jgi:hypothetical protein
VTHEEAARTSSAATGDEIVLVDALLEMLGLDPEEAARVGEAERRAVLEVVRNRPPISAVVTEALATIQRTLPEAKLAMDLSPRDVAWHEAAHIACALANEVPIFAAFAGQEAGAVQMGFMPWQTHILVLAAGDVAVGKGATPVDAAIILAIAAVRGWPPAEALDYAQQGARRFLDLVRPVHENFAEALLLRDELREPEIRAMAARCGFTMRTATPRDTAVRAFNWPIFRGMLDRFGRKDAPTVRVTDHPNHEHNGAP